MNKKRREEIKTHLELGYTPVGEPPTLEELYGYILELEDKLYYDKDGAD